MAMYQRKALVVEAKQWFVHGDHPGVCRIEEANIQDVGDGICVVCGKEVWGIHGWLDTLERKNGRMVCPGDWIITGPSGRMFSCKPDIFLATFEAVERDRENTSPNVD